LYVERNYFQTKKHKCNIFTNIFAIFVLLFFIKIKNEPIKIKSLIFILVIALTINTNAQVSPFAGGVCGYNCKLEQTRLTTLPYEYAFLICEYLCESKVVIVYLSKL